MLYFKDILLSAVHIPGLNNSRVDLSLRHFNDRIEVSPSCRFCMAYSLTYWVLLGIPDSQRPSACKEEQHSMFTDDHAFVAFPVMVPDNVTNLNHLPDPASRKAEPTNPASQKIDYFHYEINSS